MADDILHSFKLSVEDSKKYETVKSKFENHFVKRRNVIFERAKFNNRRQEQGESVDVLITALYALAEHCNYGSLHDEMVRDRIVVGIRDSSLSEKLQLDAELTLTTAITKVRQAETVKKQQPLLRGQTLATGGQRPDIPVGAVQNGKWTPKHGSWQKKSFKPKNMIQRQNSCTRCGKSPSHDRQSCPARDAVCHKCSKRGHFEAVCRSSMNVREIREDSIDTFLGGVDTEDTTNNPWRLTLLLNGTPTDFKIDTGAEVSVISRESHEKIGTLPLYQSTKTLRGPSNYALPVTGYFTAQLKHGNQEVQQEMFVVPNLRRNLLGRPAIEALGPVVMVGAIYIR